MSISIEPVARRDLPEVVALLAECLEDDPIYRDILPPRAQRRRDLERFYTAYLRPLGERGVLDLARDERGAAIGAAVWERTGVGKESALLPQLLHVPLFLRAMGLRDALAGMRLQQVLEAHRPVDPHWYLPAVVVHPSRRREGVATALLAPRLRELDEAGIAAYLESGTADDRRFFERMGFVPGAIVQGLATSRPTAMFRQPARRRR